MEGKAGAALFVIIILVREKIIKVCISWVNLRFLSCLVNFVAKLNRCLEHCFFSFSFTKNLPVKLFPMYLLGSGDQFGEGPPNAFSLQTYTSLSLSL